MGARGESEKPMNDEETEKLRALRATKEDQVTIDIDTGDTVWLNRERLSESASGSGTVLALKNRKHAYVRWADGTADWWEVANLLSNAPKCDHADLVVWLMERLDAVHYDRDVGYYRLAGIADACDLLAKKLEGDA
jgi:hypothetical protein